MSKRNRVFAGTLLIFAAGVAVLVYTIADDLDIRYREATEQVMVDAAQLLAAWVETESIAGKLNPARLQHTFDSAYRREFSAQIYAITKHRVDLRALVTDINGTVVFDSYRQDTGKDFRNWHDIHLALSGRYGARTTRNHPDDPGTTVMYVAAPVYNQGNIIGAVSVGKAVASHRELLLSAQQKLVGLGLLTLAGFLILLITVSLWLTNPARLSHDVVRVFKQERLTKPGRLLRRLRTVFHHAFLDMRDAMAGRNFSENYIQSLTHELKSPLTAIRGAAELLREPMTEAQRERFVDTITLQSQRLQDLAERLLELTAIEQRRTLDNPQAVQLQPLIAGVLQGLEVRAKAKNIGFQFSPSPTPATVFGNTFLLQRAFANLIENALDFSPLNSTVEITVNSKKKLCQITIRDHGPGIPDYALDRLFDKFYSLRRPDTGQKSTGLGLPFVREIAHLHGGKVSLVNHPKGGAESVFSLPSA